MKNTWVSNLCSCVHSLPFSPQSPKLESYKCNDLVVSRYGVSCSSVGQLSPRKGDDAELENRVLDFGTLLSRYIPEMPHSKPLLISDIISFLVLYGLDHGLLCLHDLLCPHDRSHQPAAEETS